MTEVKDNQTGVYSALLNRPAAKVVDNDDTSSYVAGVKITDEIAARKMRFNGWEKDPDALLIVRAFQSGDNAHFEKSDLTEIDFSGAVLSGINFAGADLKNANLAGVDLRGANLSGADLRGVNLEEADLEGANLEGALLDGAYLKNTKLVGVKLAKQALNELEKMQQIQREAEAGNLDLRKVNLKYLDLRRLDLRGVDLTGVDLSGVNLVGVNLTGAKIDPMYLDGSYAFKEGVGRTVEIKKGNTAGLDLATANQIKANLKDLEILRQKRLAGQMTEEQVVAEMARATEEMLKQQSVEPEPEIKPTPVFAEPEDDLALPKEVEILRARRQQQPSPEELKARMQDVVLEKRPTLKSGACSLVTHRPRRKEELPPSKYDFPILYPVDEEEKNKTVKKSAIQEVSKAVTNQVKSVIGKIIPTRGRTRVKRQRQKQRS